MAKLILVRHGKSAWNKLGLWTGKTDVDLVEEGHAEAEKAGELLRDIDIHEAHVSALKRTHQTLEGIKNGLGRPDLKPQMHVALNERDYGVHTGKNKWEIKEVVGDEEFTKIRRNWNHPIEGGETLKDVHARVVPYYEQSIKPQLAEGKNVIVVAHGNTLRALAKHLEHISDDEICELEIGTGEVHCYDIDEKGAVQGKEVRGK